ncbi:unnamed protein product [Lactuca saligna]|uniref:Uncharacterized protein n=1 Tax=Lactuca saligna TaxID=75948 RepID=A0AA35VU47_LACSI|nr:unnamed protein product [Lactuca saligna]
MIIAKKPEETVLPSQTGVFKKLKKKARPSCPAYTVKPHVTRKWVIFREVQEPVSPGSKRCQTEDMAIHISKKQRKKLQNLVINDESTEEEVNPEPPFPLLLNVEFFFLVITIIESLQVSATTPIVLSPPKVSSIETSHVQGTSIVLSATFETSTIDTSTTLPQFVSTPIDTHSPTFDNILDQPITSLFSSQSTEPPVTTEEIQTRTDDD